MKKFTSRKPDLSFAGSAADSPLAHKGGGISCVNLEGRDIADDHTSERGYGPFVQGNSGANERVSSHPTAVA
jgi:hypothetical protein